MKKTMISKAIFGLSVLGCLSLVSCSAKKTSTKSSSSSEQTTSSYSEGSSQSSETSSESTTSTSSSIDESVHVQGIYLNYDKLNLKLNSSKRLIATIYPFDATNQNIIWSSNGTCVSVEDGVVTGHSLATAIVTATTEDGGFSASCEVTVVEDDDDDYTPDPTDDGIYSITLDNLSDGTYDSEADEYTFGISGEYKQIFVNAPDKSIILELSNATITNSENSPIYVLTCDSIDISAKKKTTNTINDTRAAYTEEDSTQGKGAIYVADGDLKLKGTGTLNINAGYFNGIHGKDDVKIQKQTLSITAVNHGIKGNDSITISSGTIDISCGGDGLHTENTDISSKQKQRGNVTINGGDITINSWKDAVSAAYNAEIEELDGETISLTAKTNKYSSYDGEVIDTSDSSFYLKLSASAYSTGNYTYAAYINDAWYPATYKGTMTSSSQGGGPGGHGGPGGGGQTTYYIYEINKPQNATTFTLYRFAGANVTSFSTTDYNAVSEVKSFNSEYDMIQINVSGSRISFSIWSNYKSNSLSSKGIKAENEIYIKSGTLDIKSLDDAIHTNSDSSLENGETPLGNVNISGGTMTIATADDGVHADSTLNISGGEITVTESYEGFEGNIINISGGTSYVYASDDGVNAGSGKQTPAINITGGYLDVEVSSSGDTDGMDSNGTITQSGGVVIVKGPGSAGSSSFGAAAVDSDGAVTLKGGTIIVFGGFEKTPSTSLTRTLCSSSNVSTGSHTVTFSTASYSTTLKTTTRGCVVYSDLGNATLS